MEIKRDIYLQALLRKRGNGLIKIVTGIRRCGKSYLLGTIFRNALIADGTAENHIIQMSFDSIENEEYRNPKTFFNWAKGKITDDSTYYFLLDEIQLMDRFESALNGLNELSNVDIYVTGSNAKFLSKEIATEFAGRGDEVHMYPLSFSEFMTVYEGDSIHGLQEYMTWGGIPLVVLASGQDKAKLLHSLFDETYTRDIVNKHHIRNTRELEDLLNILSSSTGSLINPEKLMNTFKSVRKSKITANTIGTYLEYFEDSFLVESAMRFDIKGKAYIETPKKYYFTDIGLRNARLGFRQNEPTHIMENVIYNELRIRGCEVDVGVVPVAEKNEEGKVVHKQLEIDFICSPGGGQKKYYIQSAYSLPDWKKREQEVRAFLKTGDSFKKIVITNDMTPGFYDDNGILTINFLDFLTDADSLEK
jgi:uncharacterized protein